MGEHYIDPHWLFDDDEDAGGERVIPSVEEGEPIEEPQLEEWDESDEWEAQAAEDASVVEEDTEGAAFTTDEFLLDGLAAGAEPASTPISSATGPLTRRLAEVNASRPLRSVPLTLRLSESGPVTLEAVIQASEQQQEPKTTGSRRSGCSLVAVLLVLLCASSIATLVWSGIWPNLPTPLSAFGVGSHGAAIHRSSTATATDVSSGGTSTPPDGTGATPGATAATNHNPTPTPIRGPTATVGPYAQSATVTFAAATQSFRSPSSLNACPSGCDIPATVDMPSRSFLHSQHTSGGSSYWAVDILFTTASLGHIGSVSPYGTVNGRPVSCQNAPFNVNIGGGQSAWFQCVPTVVPVPANAFGCSNCFGFNYTDPYGSYQDTSNEYVTQQDCVSAENTAQGQATSWEQSYSPNVGPQLVAESVWTDSISCSPGVNQHGTTVTGSAWGHARAEGFNPTGATSAAQTQLDGQLPSGFVWKSSGTGTTAASCTPTWKAPASGSTTFTVTCVDSDTAVQVWTAASEQQLTASLAGLPFNQAVQVCDAATQSVCTISLVGGNGQTMPVNTTAIIVKVT